MITLHVISQMSGNYHAMDLPMTNDEFTACHALWMEGALIQNAFPMLNADQREFIMTGITPDEWNSMFPEEE